MVQILLKTFFETCRNIKICSEILRSYLIKGRETVPRIGAPPDAAGPGEKGAAATKTREEVGRHERRQEGQAEGGREMTAAGAGLDGLTVIKVYYLLWLTKIHPVSKLVEVNYISTS